MLTRFELVQKSVMKIDLRGNGWLTKKKKPAVFTAGLMDFNFFRLRGSVGVTGVEDIAFGVVHDLEPDLAADVLHGVVLGEHLTGDAG